ncbi:MAG: acetyl/propionyl/methylcrotonyl-CoA carboxylase subunit alpha [Pararhodobacter sp.]
MSFDTILIANRGEIACRIIRTAHAMGYRTVAVFTDADAGAPHTLLADRALRLGPGERATSYLDAAGLVQAARAAGAQAVHPGYGFLAEDAGFARLCAEAGLAFIGPAPETIAMMGDKGHAKAAMAAAGVPCLRGHEGAGHDDAALIEAATGIGFPLMVKAAAGGGGKGIRRVDEAADLPEAIARARSEAERSFGRGDLILERALIAPRHIEIQVLADGHGGVVHLGERECSIQRRHQKLLEEAPSPFLTSDLRARMGAAAVAAARACGYVGVGTVEFLVDAAGDFYFLEMNTRLQVEHPVTEAIHDLDLVEWQIRVARGEALGFTQEALQPQGHAIELRLCAEDPAQGFLPQTGRVLRWQPPAGLRCDHGIAEGGEIGAQYDSLLAKLIAHGPDRETARRRLLAGLERMVLLGVSHNQAFLAALLRHPAFIEGRTTTAFLEAEFGADLGLEPAAAPDSAMLALGALLFATRGADPLPHRLGWSNRGALPLMMLLMAGEAVYEVALRLRPGPEAVLEDGRVLRLIGCSGGLCRYRIDGTECSVPFAFDGARLFLPGLALDDRTHAPAAQRAAEGDGQVLAPMAGAVAAVTVGPGERVAQGQTVVVLEAMKMEHPLRAALAGRVRHVTVAPGAQVSARQLLIEIEPEEE